MADRRAAFERTNLAVFTAACDALAALDLRAAVQEMHLPTLVLVGENDEATPPPMSAELADLLPDARYHVLAWVRSRASNAGARVVHADDQRIFDWRV